MKQVTVAEAKKHFSKLLAQVEAGEEIFVTRYGKAVVRLVAIKTHVGEESQLKRVEQAFRRLVKLRRGVRLEGDLKAIARSGLD